MNPKNRKHLHDHFFRESMTRVAIAKGTLLTFINPLILETVDFSTFEIVKDDWISEKLKESRSDILYRAKLLNQNEWIYFLFEHKSGSSSDKNTPYQILHYMDQAWDEYIPSLKVLSDEIGKTAIKNKYTATYKKNLM